MLENLPEYYWNSDGAASRMGRKGEVEMKKSPIF
jgi:hypothetical protein